MDDFHIVEKNLYDKKGTDEEIQSCAYYMHKIQCDMGLSKPLIEEMASYVPHIANHMVSMIPNIIFPQVIGPYEIVQPMAQSAQDVSTQMAEVFFKQPSMLTEIKNTAKTVGGYIKGFVDFLVTD